MAYDQHSGRYPWEVKVDKTEVTEEGLRVEGHKEYDVKSVLKLLEECIDGSFTDGCSYFYYMPCVGSLLDDAKGCIEQLVEKIEEDEHEIEQLMLKNKGVTDYSKLLQTSRNSCVKRINELNEKISKLEDDNDYLKYEVDALTGQNKALSETLEASEKVNEELKKKLVLSNDTSEARRKSFQYYLDKSIVLEHEVESLKRQNQALSEKLGNADLKTEELKASLKEKTKAVEIAEKMLAYAPARNCINCDHYDVCMTVAERKARKANNYSPCSLWKKADEK